MKKFLKKLIGFSLRNRAAILFLTIVFIIYGIVVFHKMPIEAFPDVTNTEIVVITQWPGRSAEEVEKFVTIPLEVALSPVQQKISLRSNTIFGLSWIKIIFDDGVVDKDVRQQVMNYLLNANLPPNVQPAVQPPTGPTGEIFRYTLRSDFRDITELKTLQDWVLERQFRSVPGIADITSFGGKTKAYEIRVDPRKLNNLGITPLTVFTAVQKTNINVGGDMLIQGDQAFVVKGLGLLKDIEDIKNIIIQNQNGVPLMIKDVADVEVSNIPRLGWVSRSDNFFDRTGKTAVTAEPDVVQCVLIMRKGENPATVVKAVKEKIDYVNKYVLPRDTKIVPYYDRTDLISYATHTVLHNLFEGIIFVILLVFVFLFDWRTTIIAAIVIPISLLFAFVCLHLMGMSANLLSLGAVDFGILLDGTIVMIEGIFVILDHRARSLGMERFNKSSKLGIIRNSAAEIGKRPFYLNVIIIAALLPIFFFQKVEGKMFSPLAYTLSFALLGSLVTTLTVVPVLISILLKKNVRDTHNFIIDPVRKFFVKGFDFTYRYRTIMIIISVIISAASFYSFKFLGGEFIPNLDEGNIWLRVQTNYSVSLAESVKVANEVRDIVMTFPQVKVCAAQTGRPDDGTDVTGFYNNEFGIFLYPQDQWNPKISRDELVDSMNKKLSVIPGVSLNFSQYIRDNVEEAVSGVKGSIVLKIYGDSVELMENKVKEAYKMMKNIRGINDLGVIHNIGQPELNITLDPQRMASYNIAAADANAVLSMAVGGLAPGGTPAGTLYEGIKTFDVRIRLPLEFRNSPEKIGNIMVPTQTADAMVPLREIATITKRTGPSLIFRDGNERYAALKFSVRGRDMASAVNEAQKKVEKAITLPRRYRMAWQGDFENLRRAQERLLTVVPVSLVLIFLLLYSMFGNFKDSLLVFLNVPFSVVGGIAALHLTGTDFSISAGIGFIALFGICIQDGIILITMFKENLAHIRGRGTTDSFFYNLEMMEAQGTETTDTRDPLHQAIRLGVQARVRPVMMTALMAAIGLLPAAVSYGIGSESSRPLARVVIGGILCAMLFSLWIFPLIFRWAYRNYFRR